MSGAAEQPRVALAGGRYRVERNWGSLPAGMTFGRISTLAVASDGTVLVAQRSGPPVVMLDAAGRFAGAWGEGEVTDPHGINIDARDRVLLVDRDAHEVQVRSLDGEPLARLGERHGPRFGAPFNHPTSACAAPDGDIYVADGYGNAHVHRFGADGTHRQSWGGPGTVLGQFSTPHSIWVDRADRVLVVDRENDRVCVFDRDGAARAEWRGFHRPMDIAEDADGRLYVSDQIPRLSQLDGDGRLLGRCRPVWNTPHGIACAPDGVIYACDVNPSSLTRLVPDD